MLADLPHVLYKSTSKSNPSKEDLEESARLNEESIKKARLRRKQRAEQQDFVIISDPD